MNRTLLCRAASFVMGCSLPCLAAEYHVAQINPAADDANPGTPDKPFKTLVGGVTKARLRPGDTLFVHHGTYREEITLKNANAAQGKPGATIQIMA